MAYIVDGTRYYTGIECRDLLGGTTPFTTMRQAIRSEFMVGRESLYPAAEVERYIGNMGRCTKCLAPVSRYRTAISTHLRFRHPEIFHPKPTMDVEEFIVRDVEMREARRAKPLLPEDFSFRPDGTLQATYAPAYLSPYYDPSEVAPLAREGSGPFRYNPPKELDGTWEGLLRWHALQEMRNTPLVKRKVDA